ncbi:hypothetical protein Agub_g1657, partial [Astrephomene gubernaculifera]
MHHGQRHVERRLGGWLPAASADMPVRALAVVILFALAAPSASFHIQLGAPEHDCGSGGIGAGLKYFAQQASRWPEQLAIVDAYRSYAVNYTVTTVEANCSAGALVNSVRTLARSCHFLLSGIGYEEEQAVAANKLQKLMMLAGVTTDRVFELGLSYIYGITTSPVHYSATALKAMALRSISHVAVIWRRDGDPVLQATCLGALAQAPSLQQLHPETIFTPLNYTAAEAEAQGFFAALAARVAASGATAVVMCDVAAATKQLTGALAEVKLQLAAAFMVAGPAEADLEAAYGRYEYVLSAVQWNSEVQYGDAFFGSAAAYDSGFAAANGDSHPDADAAGASAAALTLAWALRGAFKECSISSEVAAAGDVQRLLYDPSAVHCTTQAAATAAATAGINSGSAGLSSAVEQLSDGGGVNVTGYGLLVRALQEGTFDTFYGVVEFSARRRNVGRPAATTQVQGGRVRVVGPLEAAAALLVMPIPVR